MQINFIKPGASKEIIKFCNHLKVKKPLLVTGKKTIQSNYNNEVVKELKENFDLNVFKDFSLNPKIEDAIRGKHMMDKNNCDSIISLGGGSVIDMSKLICAFTSSLDDEEMLSRGKVKLKSNQIKHIAIPTTCGTGSEATHFAVVYIDRVKYSLASQLLIPDIAIIDSKLTADLDKYNVASSIFDALCQSIESYWSKASTDESRKYAAEAIKLILNNIDESISSPLSESRRLIVEAAHLSGKAINLTKTTAPHALSYKISEISNIAHGHAVALTLGKFFELNERVSLNNKQSHNDTMLLRQKEIYQMMDVHNSKEAEILWYKMMSSCKLTNNLSELSLDNNESIKEVIDNINIERLNNHPVKLRKDDLISIFNV